MMKNAAFPHYTMKTAHIWTHVIWMRLFLSLVNKSFQIRFMPLSYVVIDHVSDQIFSIEWKCMRFLNIIQHCRHGFIQCQQWLSCKSNYKITIWGNQWRCGQITLLIDIGRDALDQAKLEGTYHKRAMLVISVVTGSRLRVWMWGMIQESILGRLVYNT